MPGDVSHLETCSDWPVAAVILCMSPTYRCYLECIAHAISTPAATQPVLQQQQRLDMQPGLDGSTCQDASSSIQVLQFRTAAISNSQQILQLATFLQAQEQQAAAVADMAEQYAAWGDATRAAAATHYVQCLALCVAAVSQPTAISGSSSSRRWVQDILIRVVPAAVDVHLSLVSLWTCSIFYFLFPLFCFFNLLSILTFLLFLLFCCASLSFFPGATNGQRHWPVTSTKVIVCTLFGCSVPPMPHIASLLWPLNPPHS